MYLTTDPLEIGSLLLEAQGAHGAICHFLGVVRNESGGRETTGIHYEAYGAMAEMELAKIAADLAEEFPKARIVIRHRLGLLSVGEASVAVAAAAPHRAEAFAACRAAIDRIKRSVPIWKKEIRPDGSSEWVVPSPAAP